jgi:hypothetical protein
MSSLELCFQGFQLIMADSVHQLIINLTFACSFVVEVFFYCYASQLIQDKSSSVAKDFYECDKEFIIIIARSQKAEVVKSGFFEVNLVTFTSIMRSALSLITLLKSFL